MTDCFEQDLKVARDFHGGICTGIVFGVRIARAGLNYLGIKDPLKNKDFIVFVEADRCIADAVYAVTRCSLGRRRLKWVDYGKMAASFVDIESNKGVRIVVNTKRRAPEGADMVAFWGSIPDEELLKIEPIVVKLKKEDLPGKPLRRVMCEECGEFVMDGRDVLVDGRILCKACANGAYYERI